LIPFIVALLSFAQAAQPLTSTSYVPQRVYDTHRKAFTDFETMLADLGRADVVFVGEQHDDPNTHRLELALLEGLARRKAALVVALEMFERDAQPALDEYTAGKSTEEQFLGASRPWPRYKTDYRPAVEFARAQHIPLVASNVPRRIAADVAKNGLRVLDDLGGDRRLAAADVRCPTSGRYYERFADLMKDHPSSGSTPPAAAREKNERFYLAQCLKDETMGESVASAVQSAGRSTAVHINGAFHSDFGQGTVERARRRLPGRRLVVISIVPVPDLDVVRPDKPDRKRADYLVFTVTAAAPASPR
jgi:uncharacterized iron-regulated protein